MKKMINSLHFRVLALLISGNVLIIGIMSVVTFVAFEKSLIAEIGTNRSDVLSQISERFRVVRNNAYTLSNLYYYDTTLNSFLKDGSKEMTPQLENHLNNITYQYKTSFGQTNMDYYMVLNIEEGGGYCSDIVSSDYDYMAPHNKIWYKDIYRAKGEIFDIASYKDRQRDISTFSVARIIFDTEENPLAYLMININERQIYEMYQGVISQDSNIYIVDVNGTVVSSNIERLKGFNLFSMPNLDVLFGDSPYIITKISGRTVLFTKHYDELTRFTVLEEIPLQMLLRPIERVRLIVILVALGGILVAFLCTWSFAKKTLMPIQKLADFMMTVEADNLHSDCKVSGYHEINILSQGLNGMLARIRSLLENEKNKEQQKRKLELGFLQAQINPHFMYNTLFSIKCMVDMGKNEQAVQMLTSFIQLLRSTLSNPNEFVTIATEWEVLRQYAEIQKYRYSDKIQIIMECDDTVKDKKIPKLLIQPLVENAIFHGIEGNGGQGMVIIIARIMNEKMVITVEDDGAGIAPELMDRINCGEAGQGRAHIGIQNVKERIQLYFGKECDIDIQSVQGEGTKITLTFPVIE